jgi:anti-sigma28 factor (negative regulator of flagellin synthesis)
MSNKQIHLFEGDVSIIASGDPTVYGSGMLTIASNLVIGGSLTVSGGVSSVTVSNVGVAGIGLFKQAVANDLEFYNINSSSSKLSVTLDPPNNEVDLDIVESNIVHQNLSGAGTNTHAQIDSHIANTNNPHSVDINDVTPTISKGDLLVESGSTVDRLSVGTNGQVLLADSSQSLGVRWGTPTSSDTASNVGVAGVGLFKQKTGGNFEFRNINAASSKISVTLDAPNNEVDLNVVEANVVHQNLSGAGTNTHAQIDTHIASTSNPHSVTINQIKPTTTKGDLFVDNGIIATRLAVGTNTQILSANSAQSTGLEWISAPSASNVGVGGIGLFKQVTAGNFEFRNINAASSKISVVLDAPNNEVDLNIVEANVVHQNLSGAGTNTHAQIDTHIASTSNPHSVTINQIKPTTTKGDLFVDNGIIATRLAVGTNTQILSANSAQSTGLEWISAPSASNVGVGGIGLFKQVTAGNFEFRNINAASSKISVTLDAPNNEVDLNVVEANIIHQSLSGAGTNTHAQIDTHIASTSNPHSVTINQIKPTTTKGDFIVDNGTIAVRFGVGANGQALIADSAQATGVTWGSVASTDTASNVGVAGVGLFKQKTGGNFEFRNINAASSKISVTLDAPNNEVDLNVVEANIIHQSLSGAGTNTHSQIDTHIASTSNPHSVTINQIKPTTTKGDLFVDNGVIATRLAVGTNTQILSANSAQSTGLEWISAPSASNVGVGGVGLFKQVTAGNFEFRNINAASSKISVVLDAPNNEVDLNVVEANVVHQNLSGAGTNTHAQIDTHIGSTSNPHSVTINQIKPTTTKGDLIVDNGTIAVRFGVGSNGQALIADSTQATGVTWGSVASTDTASNVGVAGVGLFKQKTGGNFEFRNINAASSKISVVLDAPNNEVDLNVVEANVIHQNLSGAGTNTHAQIDTHIASTSNPHSVTINQIKPTTTKGDLFVDNGIIATRLAVGTNTQILSANSAQSTGLEWISAPSASNVGVGGIGLFKQVTAGNFEFRNINAASSKISVVLDAPNNEVDLNIVEANVVHQNLSGAGTNTHAQIDTHIASTSNPHSVTINQIKPTTTKGDLFVDNGIIATRLAVGTNTQILSANSAQSTGLEWISAPSASNVGVGGVGLFKQVTAGNFEFRNINAASSKISVVLDAPNNEVDLNVVEANVIHQNLSGAGTNTHAQIDTHIASTSNPHSTTINQIKPTTTKGDLIVDNGTSAVRFGVGANGQALIADSTQATGVTWGSVASSDTASNIGVAGVGLFKQKTGGNFEFRNINAGSTKISVTLDAPNNEVDLNVVEANIIHQSLSGAGTNTHAQIDTHIGSTSNPHSVTINQIKPTTTKGDLFVDNGIIATRLAVGTNTQILSANSAQSTGLEWISAPSASNVGVGGVGLFKQVTAGNFEFRNINAASSKISVVLDAPNNEVDLNVVEANIIHQSLSGAGTNTHAQIDTHIGSTSNPHSVTINQITPTTTKGDLLVSNGTIVTRLGVGTNGQALIADSTQATGVTWGSIVSSDTASNVGVGGVGLFKQKTGSNYEFRNINAASTKISVVLDTPNNEVDLNLVEANVVHQNLSGAGTNTHAQIDTHIGSTSNPHSVTINQIKPTTTKGDLIVDNGTVAVRLPVGTNGQFLSANSAQATGLEWITLSVAFVKDVKAVSTNGGTFTAGSFVVRDLNTLEGNAGSHVSLASNQITLQPGKYLVTASCPGYLVSFHQCRLFNVTDNAVEILGTSERAGANNVASRSDLMCYINISSTKVYQLEHRCATTRANDGRGTANGFNNEVYSMVSIQVLE